MRSFLLFLVLASPAARAQTAGVAADSLAAAYATAADTATTFVRAPARVSLMLDGALDCTELRVEFLHPCNPTRGGAGAEVGQAHTAVGVLRTKYGPAVRPTDVVRVSHPIAAGAPRLRRCATSMRAPHSVARR